MCMVTPTASRDFELFKEAQAIVVSLLLRTFWVAGEDTFAACDFSLVVNVAVEREREMSHQCDVTLNVLIFSVWLLSTRHEWMQKPRIADWPYEDRAYAKWTAQNDSR